MHKATPAAFCVFLAVHIAVAQTDSRGEVLKVEAAFNEAKIHNDVTALDHICISSPLLVQTAKAASPYRNGPIPMGKPMVIHPVPALGYMCIIARPRTKHQDKVAQGVGVFVLRYEG